MSDKFHKYAEAAKKKLAEKRMAESAERAAQKEYESEQSKHSQNQTPENYITTSTTEPQKYDNYNTTIGILSITTILSLFTTILCLFILLRNRKKECLTSDTNNILDKANTKIIEKENKDKPNNKVKIKTKDKKIKTNMIFKTKNKKFQKPLGMIIFSIYVDIGGIFSIFNIIYLLVSMKNYDLFPLSFLVEIANNVLRIILLIRHKYVRQTNKQFYNLLIASLLMLPLNCVVNLVEIYSSFGTSYISNNIDSLFASLFVFTLFYIYFRKRKTIIENNSIPGLLREYDNDVPITKYNEKDM